MAALLLVVLVMVLLCLCSRWHRWVTLQCLSICWDIAVTYLGGIL
jgi:hypothetical protein